jgi:DNA-binding transcriptional LysR family regulator
MFKSIVSHLPYFAAVAKHLSFSKAANDMSISQSAMSYQIQKLESKLGFSLLIRGQGSKVEISSRGKMLLDEYVLMEKSINQLLNEIQLKPDKAQIKLTAPIDFGVKIMTPLLPELSDANLHIDLNLTDDVVHLSKSFFDLSIRNNTQEKQIEYLPLLAIDNLLICSKRYAHDNKLYDLNDLAAHHRFIVRDSQRSKSWQSLLSQSPIDYQTHANKQVISNSFGMLAAVDANLGVAVLPKYFISSLSEANTMEHIQIVSSDMSSTQYYIAYQDSFMARNWAQRIKQVLVDHTQFDKS